MDNTDNIGGVAGVGDKSILLKGLDDMINPSEEEMFQYVKNIYINKYGLDAERIMIENYILLNMMTKPCFDYPLDIKPIKYKEEKSNRLKLIDI